MNRIDLLTNLVTTYSPTGEEGRVTPLLSDILTRQGWKVQLHEVEKGRNNILATKNPSKKAEATLFLGHQDVVPISKNEVFIKDNKLYGRGSLDMKSGIVCALEATQDTDKYVKMLLTVDEEDNSLGAFRAVADRRDFFDDVAVCISAEPNLSVNADYITTGRSGRTVYEVTAYGDGRHWAETNNTSPVNNIGKLIQLLSSDPLVLFNNLYSKHSGLSVPCEAGCNLEYYGNQHDTLIETAKTCGVEIRLKDRNTPYLQPYAFANILNGLIPFVANSVADDNVIATLGIPTYTYGPVGAGVHTEVEYVNLDSLDRVIAVYRSLIDYSS